MSLVLKPNIPEHLSQHSSCEVLPQVGEVQCGYSEWEGQHRLQPPLTQSKSINSVDITSLKILRGSLVVRAAKFSTSNKPSCLLRACHRLLATPVLSFFWELTKTFPWGSSKHERKIIDHQIILSHSVSLRVSFSSTQLRHPRCTQRRITTHYCKSYSNTCSIVCLRVVRVAGACPWTAGRIGRTHQSKTTSPH